MQRKKYRPRSASVKLRCVFGVAQGRRIFGGPYPPDEPRRLKVSLNGTPLAAAELETISALDKRFRQSLLRHFGRRFSETCELEDMVQEVFVRLIRRGGVASLENLQAYVFETASSVLNDRLRRMRTRHETAHEPFDADLHANVDFSPEDVLLGKERLARATAALLELPERTRVIFVLRRLEGMRFQDIASRLGISVSAVEKHMQRAIAHMIRRRDPE